MLKKRKTFANDDSDLRHQFQKADLVLVGGKVISLDSDYSVHESLAITGERISAIGDSEQILTRADKDTRVIDLKGRAVLPGFADCHVHLNDGGTTITQLLDFGISPDLSVDQFLDRIAQQASHMRKGQWVLGKRVPFLDLRLWSANGAYLGRDRHPTRWDIDRVAPDNPVFVVGRGNHVGLGNSKALHLAGIGRETPNPMGGTIVRVLSTGEPTGILIQKALSRLDMRQRDCVIPPFTEEQYLKGIEVASQMLVRNGITIVHDVVVSPNEIRAYQEAARRKELPIRVRLMIRGSWGSTEQGSGNREFGESKIDFDDLINLGIQTGFGDDRIRVTGVKISIDGPGGIIRVPQDELNSRVRDAHAAGLRVCLHAITSRGLPMAIEAIREAVKETPRKDQRHRIEHCGNLSSTSDHAQELSRLGIIASAQPVWLYSLCEPEEERDEETSSPYPLSELLQNGVRVIAGSDWPFAPADPILGIYAAVARRNERGTTVAPSQRIDVRDAILMYTSNAAYSTFEEETMGSLEPGKLADLVVLSEDPLTLPADRLRNIKVDITIGGGVILWDREHSYESTESGSSAGRVAVP